MDRNLLLAFALSFLVLSLWTMLQKSNEPQPGGSPEAYEQQDAAVQDAASGSEAEEAPVAPRAAAPLPPAPAALEAPAVSPQPSVETGDQIDVETPLFHARLDTLGAALVHWGLREYDQGPKHDRAPVVLTTGGPSLLTPLEELGLGDLAHADFVFEQPDANTFAFILERDGVTVRKTYEFREDSYAFRLRVQVENHSQAELGPRFALTWSAAQAEGPDFKEQALSAMHDGSMSRQMIQGLGRAGLVGSLTGRAPQLIYDYAGDVDWAGVQTTYFLSAAFPDTPSQASARLSAVEPGKSGLVVLFFPPVQLPPGQDALREFRVYLGPKDVDHLAALGPSAVHSIDLGWTWMAPMTRFFTWLLSLLHAIIPNYGVAIIILTILVRVVTAPLTTRQMRSMERMRELQPKLKALQEKYPDDRQKQSEETMRLYRSEGVNPLGGCFPMVLQLPVMIGLFYALRSSIQLRQSPFFGWIDDLSAPETLFVIPGLELPVRVLPLVMGVTMVLQQRMTPMNVDPTQARMMMTVMPIMMTFLFYQFASGLVLYWMVGNVLAIGHQLLIRRRKAAKE